MVHALDIYEIRLQIGKFLSQSSLIACSQTSTSWRDTFYPLCWQYIFLDSRRVRRPSIGVLSRYASNIRSLKYCGYISRMHYDFSHDPEKSVGPLHSLHFLHGEKYTINYYWDTIVSAVIAHRSTLKKLYIEDVRCSPPNLFWNTISMHNHQLDVEDENQPECDEIWYRTCGDLSSLKHLRLSMDETIYSSEWCQLLSGCQNLHTLDLRLLRISISLNVELGLKYSIKDWPALAEQPRFMYIQDLTLYQIRNLNSKVCLRAIICQCPSLRSLSWRIKKGQGFPAREFSKMVAAKSWKYLNSLEVWGGKVRIDDHNLAKIMRCLPNLRKFCVKGSQVGTFTSSILLSESPTVNYAMNVYDLDFYKCNYISSHMVHKFLTGFPNLTRFRANKIETEEALHEEPWVCTKLKTLSLFFDLGDQSNQWSILNSETWKPSPDIPMDSFRTIYSQLARLTQLDILDTQRHFPTKLLIQREPEYTIHGQRTIGFRLEEGLELLASLTKLRDLRMQQPPHGMRSEDADWIKENWPELEVLDHGGWNFHKSGIYHRHPNGRIIRPGMLRQHEQ